MHQSSCPKTTNQYDLVVFGGSLIGLASAYFAGKLSSDLKVCVITNKKYGYYQDDRTYHEVSNPIQNNEKPILVMFWSPINCGDNSKVNLRNNFWSLRVLSTLERRTPR